MMGNKIVRLTLVSFLLTFHLLQAQNDFLSTDFHKERREMVRKKLPANSVAVFFSNAVRNRSNDVDYEYHQDPNFYYLTGHKQPHALLLIFKENQIIDGNQFNEMLFVRNPNPLKELYDGNRVTVEEAIRKLGLQSAAYNTYFENIPINFQKFDQVLFFDFHDDVRNTDEKGDLYDLIVWFKQKTNYVQSNQINREPKKSNLNTKKLTEIMHDLRGIKTPEEIELIRKAVFISAVGQAEVMKAIEPGMSEREVQGMHEFIYKKYQAEYEGYPSIVGAGNNGCTLHYIENYKPKIEDGELILMDLGAEYHGYTADVTRTIPVNGKFSPEQALIYDLVYDAQEAAMAICKAGVSFDALYKATADVINEGLVKLGLYTSTKPKDIVDPKTGRNRYYPHGCCHHIGLDVHDMGHYDKLRAHMVITIEPGIYIPEGSPSDPKWWGIPVRIEDDYLVTEEGCELLSGHAPRKREEIEALMKQPSSFKTIQLPDLK